MKTVIYARYSAGPKQTDQSIEGQVRVCEDYCKRNNLDVIEVYADRHISGKTDDRPEFQRLIADSKLGKFEAVCVYKTDRFARNKYDSAIYKRQLKQAGIKIYYAAEAIPDGPEGIILESLMEGLAEYYSAELAQKIKRGMHESALKCKVMGNNVPLGYVSTPDHYFEIDPEGAKAVNQVFKMYIEGSKNSEIISYLNDHGFRTSQGNEFNKNSINRIIKNEKYIGVYSAAGVTIKDGLPAIIDEETFYLAQAELEKRKVKKTVRPTSANYLLSGKMFCGHCGKAMIGVSGTAKNGSKHFYYYCPNARKKSGCAKKHVQKAYIETLIVDLTKDYILQSDVLEDVVGKILAIQNESDDRDEQISYYKKKLQDAKKAAQNLLMAVEKGLATDTILERLDSLEREQRTYMDEIAFQERKTFGLTGDQLLFFLMRMFQEDNEDPGEYLSRIIKTFVAKVTLFDDKIEIEYNISNAPKTTQTLENTEVIKGSTTCQKSGPEGSLVEPYLICVTLTSITLTYTL